jgi:Na+/melibiose symporter-like transporter
VIGVVALLIYLTYPLSEEKVKVMTAELEKRRQQESEGAKSI